MFGDYKQTVLSLERDLAHAKSSFIVKTYRSSNRHQHYQQQAAAAVVVWKYYDINCKLGNAFSFSLIFRDNVQWKKERNRLFATTMKMTTT